MYPHRTWKYEQRIIYGRYYIRHMCKRKGPDMTVSEQYGIAASKGNQILGLIRRNITYMEKKLMIPLYKAIFRPYLEYCIQAWRPIGGDKIYRILLTFPCLYVGSLTC